MQEILLRKVLSKKHNIRFDRCGTKCAYGDVVIHYCTLLDKKHAGKILMWHQAHGIHLSYKEAYEPWPPQQGKECSTGDTKQWQNFHELLRVFHQGCHTLKVFKYDHIRSETGTLMQTI